MSLSVLIIGLFAMMIISYRVSKDLLYPGFLFPIPWIIFLILLQTSSFDFNPDSSAYLYFLVGAFVFEIGVLSLVCIRFWIDICINDPVFDWLDSWLQL